jgi:hypothetical protein
MTSPFAGRRRNGDLGRSVDVRGGLFLCGRARRRQWVPLGRRGGERRQRALIQSHAPGARANACLSRTSGDTSFTRSKDPCSSIVAQLRRCKPTVATRLGSHRGRANPGNREEPTPRLIQSDAARLAACHRSRKRAHGDAYRKGRRSRPPSLRGSRELGSKCPHVVAVAEVSRRCLVSNKLLRSAPKRVAAGVNGGLARSGRRRQRRRTSRAKGHAHVGRDRC